MILLWGSVQGIQYRVLLNKIEQIQKNYVRKISKAELIAAAFFELLKEIPEHEQNQFLVQNMNWFAQHYPSTQHNLLQKALTGVAKVLDEYSAYLPPEKFRDTVQMGQGKIAGIGLELFEKNGMVEIVGMTPSSPAATARLKPGDLILMIDGKDVEPKKEDIIQKLRGQVGSEVVLQIQRGHQIFNVRLKRQMIQVASIYHAVYQDILYMRLNYFTQHTYLDMKQILKANTAIKGCVLDLRNNPGGLYQQGVLISGLFLAKGTKVLKVKKQDSEEIFYAREHDYLRKKPLVILVNRATASSAEIVAGSLKDAKRATLVGEDTLGKGTVQDIRAIFPSVFFGGFKYTVAEFFTASGGMIQNNGIKPHLYAQGEVSYHCDPSVLIKTDQQFQKCMEVLENSSH